MTYQEIVNILKVAANSAAPDGTFVHAKRYDGAVVTIENETTFPVVNLLYSKVTESLSQNRQTWNVAVLFWLQDSPDNTLDDRAELLFQAETIKEDFLRYVMNQNVTIENVSSTPEPERMASTVSGWGLTFNLIEKSPLNFYDPSNEETFECR
jgi:hypothetical protein